MDESPATIAAALAVAVILARALETAIDRVLPKGGGDLRKDIADIRERLVRIETRLEK